MKVPKPPIDNLDVPKWKSISEGQQVAVRQWLASIGINYENVVRYESVGVMVTIYMIAHTFDGIVRTAREFEIEV